MASLIARTLAVLIPIVLLLIPGIRIAPAIYRWRIESRIHRWYKVLLDLEREAQKSTGPERRAELLKKLDDIEANVNRIVVPASFGDLFYGLRGHVNFVRNSLLGEAASAATTVGAGSKDAGASANAIPP